MKESKHQHRTRMIDTSIPSKPVTEDEHTHWPVGPLPNIELDPKPEEESIQEEGDKPIEQPSEKEDNGFDEWSVSWP